MKKTDIAMIILIATVGVMVSFFVVKSILGSESTDLKKVQTIDEISTAMPEVNKRIFNSSAINPSVGIEIDGSTATNTDSSGEGN